MPKNGRCSGNGCKKEREKEGREEGGLEGREGKREGRMERKKKSDYKQKIIIECEF